MCVSVRGSGACGHWCVRAYGAWRTALWPTGIHPPRASSSYVTKERQHQKGRLSLGALPSSPPPGSNAPSRGSCRGQNTTLHPMTPPSHISDHEFQALCLVDTTDSQLLPEDFSKIFLQSSSPIAIVSHWTCRKTLLPVHPENRHLLGMQLREEMGMGVWALHSSGPQIPLSSVFPLAPLLQTAQFSPPPPKVLNSPQAAQLPQS
jgi:hypothetical protein